MLGTRHTGYNNARLTGEAGWGCAMQHYRVYVLGEDDHFINAIDLSCADDIAAIESAKQLIDGHDLELWQRDRRIARSAHANKSRQIS